MKKNRISDIDLTSKINDEVRKEYISALEFISIAPDHSLLKFRQIIEHICEHLIKKSHIEILSENKIYYKINKLYIENIIDLEQKKLLHTIRKNCNYGIHKYEQKIEIQNNNSDIHDFDIDKILSTKANEARQCLILFIYKFLISQKKVNKETQIQLSEINDNEIKTTLLNSCFKISSEEKYKAGIIYESIADKNKRKYYDLIID